MTLVSPSRQIVIFLAEKCASTSIREALVGHEDWERIQGPLVQKPEWDDWQRLGVTRSPYSRIYSYWKYWKSIGEMDCSFEEMFEQYWYETVPKHAKSILEWYKDVDITNYLWFERLQQDFDSWGFGVTLHHLNAVDGCPPYAAFQRLPGFATWVTIAAKADIEKFGYSEIRGWK